MRSEAAGCHREGTSQADECVRCYVVRDGGVKLIVGLGNPGIEYQFTPHNLGFLTIDRIAGNLGVEVRNRQCRALTARTVLADQMVLESDLIVIQDELDFPLGTLRIHTRRSSAGHNGIESIIGALGTQDFLRIRIGVAPERKVEDGAAYLLAPMKKKDMPTVDEMLDKAEEAVKMILRDGPAAAMNRFNRKEPDEEKD
jgi:PTH1 family peptidyl-tRNA hydrolase